MKRTNTQLFYYLFMFICAICFCTFPSVFACTTVSGVAADGQVWNANNEDGPAGLANFINVFPASGPGKYGYYTLSYFSPANGDGVAIQGGMNEAGLTFDFNAIKRVEYSDFASKKAFPKGDDAILSHILSSMSSVQEVINFFSIYWFESGFMSAQMHLADRAGNFAIISASGMKVVANGQSLISTNFDICGGEDGSSCWRYPVATEKLLTAGAGLSTMIDICRATAQKKYNTMYSNIHNLTTGDVWFFSNHDPGLIVNTNIREMLSRGKRSYTFSDLRSLVKDRVQAEKPVLIAVDLDEQLMQKYCGSYYNSFSGRIEVQREGGVLEFSFADGSSEVFYAQTANRFFVPEEEAIVEFEEDETGKQMTLNLYENGFWVFKAWKKSLD